MQTELRSRNFSQPKQVFWLNEGFQADTSNENSNRNILVSGTSGGGKTVLESCLCDQVGRGILLDTKGKGRDTIEEIGLHGWEFFNADDERLQTNISELSSNSISVLEEEGTQREIAMRAAFNTFFRLPSYQRNFSSLKKILSSFKQTNLAYDLELIFDKKEKGMPLSKIAEKKICWNIRGLSKFHRGPGLLLQVLYDYFYLHRSHSPYFLAIDDAQTNATSKTAIGRAFAKSFSEARAFNLINLLCGTHDTLIRCDIKQNPGIVFYFPSKSKTERNKQLNEGIDFSDARMVALRRGRPVGCAFIRTDLPVFLKGRQKVLEDAYPFYFDYLGYLKSVSKPFQRGDTLPVEQDFFG